MAFISLYIYFIIGCFLVSLSVYLKTKREYRYLRLFPPFLFLTILVELFATYISNIGKPNTIVYNCFVAPEISFYLFVISMIIKSTTARKMIRLITILFLPAGIINLVFFQGPDYFNTITVSFGGLLVVLACMYYFIELFRLPKSQNLQANPAFWICTGLLFFYSVTFPLFGFINELNNIAPILVNNLFMITSVSNILLYTLFAVSFVCIRMVKYTS